MNLLDLGEQGVLEVPGPLPDFIEADLEDGQGEPPFPDLVAFGRPDDVWLELLRVREDEECVHLVVVKEGACCRKLNEDPTLGEALGKISFPLIVLLMRVQSLLDVWG